MCECSQPSSRGNELKRLISSGQNGKLASSGAANSPDTDDAQPVDRADLTRLLRRMHGTRKPRTSPDARGKEQAKSLANGNLQIARKAKP